MNRDIVEIPNKSSFKINEVCALTGIKSYVLRFWESEFKSIAPLTTTSGIKLYEHRDVEAILAIKKLLFEDKLSIENAKILMDSRTKNSTESLEEFDFSEDFSVEAGVRNELTPVSSQLPLAQRVLLENDFKKIISAKNKLHEILLQCKILQEKNNWL